MPGKYHINIRTVPPRSGEIPEFCSIESGACLRCNNCAKYSACIYGIHQKRSFDYVQVLDTGDSECAGCMRCVQECKANILTRIRNSRFDSLGNDYWTPDLVYRTWKQAETGKIPVSGAGYRGPFCGPGFDQMWTDMSEIVRPTRDGIHGREYISTVIELGRKPGKLEFDAAGKLLTVPPPFVEIPLPLVLDIPAQGLAAKPVREATARAAAKLRTLAVAGCDEARTTLAAYRKNLVVRFDPARDSLEGLEDVPVLELEYSENVLDVIAGLKENRPDIVTSIRLPLDEFASSRTAGLAEAGAEVIHLQAGPAGRGLGTRGAEFVTGLVREVHLKLVEESLRERLTLLVSGGIAMAEHVAKIMICGVDGVGVDDALMVAMECRMCGDCDNGHVCPVRLDRAPVEYGSQRIVNLIGSWHSQLIEVMGAMGMREVRRLRGEVGRAMFFDDLEKENFAPIFGERDAAKAVSAGQAEDTPAEPPRPVLTLDGEAWSYPAAKDLIEPCPSRFRNRLSRYLVARTAACVSCGRCADVCAHGVFTRSGGRMPAPRSYLCVGPELCRENGETCFDSCPQKALRVNPDPAWETFGDPRWTPDLLVSTWMQAESGTPPDNGLEYRTGASGGGFDRIDFLFPDEPSAFALKPEDIDLSLPLNRRNDRRPQIEIGFPVYGGGMSFGAVSLPTLVSRAKAYMLFNSFTCTGEGGYPEELTPYRNHVITQVATGLFGVREETIQRARIVEFKYAQGAKPGLGGHLLGDKVTPAVARMRESVEGNALFSPFPFHSVYSVEDHKKHVDWIKAVNPHALVAVKVSSPTDVDMVAVGSYYAGAHIIHIDGSYGGTGAAPDIAKKNIAMPVEYAIPKVHQFLVQEGIRNQMTLVASGGIRTAWDIAKAIALGADAAVIATSELVALECIRCGRCESGRGCPRGIATTDPVLSKSFTVEWAVQRLVNLFNSYCVQLQYILWRLGLNSVRELAGRSDLLIHRDYHGRKRPVPEMVEARY
ncbi:MAG: alpha-hydroxy-acid oxidizing protein [Dehalococcoidia bacterium]|nr:alpha-hydroxy-acid oxidizing protein [Dehalococcoidia bacterium]